MTRDPGLIYAGDPRHPCQICGGRDRVSMHFMECGPVPLSEAYKPEPEWGEAIIRPQKLRYPPLWLASDVPVKVGETILPCKDHTWINILSFQVPADHKHYTTLTQP